MEIHTGVSPPGGVEDVCECAHCVVYQLSPWSNSIMQLLGSWGDALWVCWGIMALILGFPG